MNKHSKGQWVFGLSNMILNILLIYIIFLLPISTDAKCPDGTFEDSSNSTCYWYVPITYGWSGAQAVCHILGWKMVSIHNVFTNKFLQEKLKEVSNASLIWLGASDLPCQPCTKYQWEWDDGSKFDYSNFAPGREATYFLQGAAMNLTTGQWYALDPQSFNSFPSVCMKYYPRDSNPRCPIDAFAGASPLECFTFNKTRLDWQSAENVCITKGGHLASIHGSDTNNLIQQRLASLVQNKTQRVWIGAYSAWEGNHYQSKYEWLWSDVYGVNGTDAFGFDFNNFDKNYNSAPEESYSGALDVSNGKWYSQQEDTIYPFLCKVPMIN